MIELSSLTSVGLAFFLVAISPGPANISNATIAMSHGRKESFVYACGLSCGLAFWGLIAASGMGAVLQSSLYVLMVLKVLGGLYLLWLALLSARSAWRSELESTTPPSSQNLFVKGLLLNISNPKSVIAWMAALSIGLNANDNLWSIVAATLVCISVGFLVNVLYTILFSMMGVMQWYQHCRIWVSRVVATLFALAGFGLIRSAFTSD